MSLLVVRVRVRRFPPVMSRGLLMCCIFGARIGRANVFIGCALACRATACKGWCGAIWCALRFWLLRLSFFCFPPCSRLRGKYERTQRWTNCGSLDMFARTEAASDPPKRNSSAAEFNTCITQWTLRLFWDPNLYFSSTQTFRGDTERWQPSPPGRMVEVSPESVDSPFQPEYFVCHLYRQMRVPFR